MRWFKNIIGRIAYRCLPQSGVPILTYHSVGYDDSFTTVRPEEFMRQMTFLRQAGWEVWSLNKLLQTYEAGDKWPDQAVVLTFDDVYKDTIEHAIPVLIEQQFPATFFVPTGLVGTKLNTKDGFTLALADWAELERLQKKPLFTIESHTHMHRRLTELESSELTKEMQLSKMTLQEKLAIVSKVVAYPKGKQNQLIRTAAAAVYDYGVATQLGNVTRQCDRYQLPRKGVFLDTTIGQFMWLLRRSR